MADVMRYRSGPTNPVSVAVESATVIEVGDMVMLVSGYAEPFSDQADLGTKAQNQEGAHDAFIGVSMDRSRAGDTTPITVATTGAFEFIATSASYALGALVGPAGTGASDAVGVANQTVEAVATANLAVGRVVRASGTATTALVEIVSTVTRGGPMTMA